MRGTLRGRHRRSRSPSQPRHRGPLGQGALGDTSTCPAPALCWRLRPGLLMAPRTMVAQNPPAPLGWQTRDCGWALTPPWLPSPLSSTPKPNSLFQPAPPWKAFPAPNTQGKTTWPISAPSPPPPPPQETSSPVSALTWAKCFHGDHVPAAWFLAICKVQARWLAGCKNQWGYQDRQTHSRAGLC